MPRHFCVSKIWFWLCRFRFHWIELSTDLTEWRFSKIYSCRGFGAFNWRVGFCCGQMNAREMSSDRYFCHLKLQNNVCLAVGLRPVFVLLFSTQNFTTAVMNLHYFSHKIECECNVELSFRHMPSVSMHSSTFICKFRWFFFCYCF